MRYRWLSVSGWLVAIVLLTLTGRRWVAGQGTFPDGAFVRTSDGTLVVVSNGVKIPLQAVNDDANQTAALRAVAAVATVADLEAALAAIAPPPPPPANPAQTLVGQGMSTCSFGTHFDVAVARAFWVKTIGGRDAAGNAMWVVAVVDVTVSDNRQSSDPTRGATKVRDERGREFENIYPTPLADAITAEFGVPDPLTPTYRPGITEQVWMLFQVAGDATQLTLLPSPSGYDCGPR